MTETTPADDRPGVTPHRLTAELLAASPAEQTALRQQIAEALAGHAGSKAFLADGHEWEHARSAWYAHADAVQTVLPDPAAIRAAALNEGADAIDAETRQAKADGVLEPDKFRPCRDASAQLRALAGCQECAWGVEHTEHCPYPESHNWGCGCPTDQSAASRHARPDPIECSHEAALGQAEAAAEAYRLALSQALGLGTGANWEALRDRARDLAAEKGELEQGVRRLGITVDEYGRGASALSHKLKDVRDLHRATCILARGEVKPGAFTCGMCDLLDAPASGPGRAAGETQQGECGCDPAPHREDDGTYSHWGGCPIADAQQAADEGTTADKAYAAGLTDTEYRARSHAAAVAAVRAAIPGMYAHVGHRLEDVLNEGGETQQDEDPARIDRLRPEFTDHASVEAIDGQLRRARSQERRWHLRTEWLTGLRQTRVEQQARGEWPAVVSQPGKEA